MNNPILISKTDMRAAFWITLDARIQSALLWDDAIEKAQEASQKGRMIFWELQLGLEEKEFPIHDEGVFEALGKALKYFRERVFSLFSHNSIGAAIYRGPLDLSSIFSSNETSQNEPSFEKKEYYLDLYATYFQVLAHKMPDDLPIYALFDASGLSRMEALYLLSQERFEHFQVAVRNLNCIFWCLGWEEALSSLGWIGNGHAPILRAAPTLGVCLSSNLQYLESFKHLLDALDTLSLPYRIVSEPFLTQEWDGLEELIVVSSSIGKKEKRKLLGFCAAGGRVISFGEKLEIPLESSWEEFRGRGIRTPDLLVPNQPR